MSYRENIKAILELSDDPHMKLLVEGLRADKEIASLRLEIEADNRNVNDLMDQVHELSNQLANSIPKERVQALIDYYGDEPELYMQSGTSIVFMLNELLSNE